MYIYICMCLYINIYGVILSDHNNTSLTTKRRVNPTTTPMVKGGASQGLSAFVTKIISSYFYDNGAASVPVIMIGTLNQS